MNKLTLILIRNMRLFYMVIWTKKCESGLVGTPAMLDINFQPYYMEKDYKGKQPKEVVHSSIWINPKETQHIHIQGLGHYISAFSR